MSVRAQGNYLVFVPSHSYLAKLQPLLEELLPEAQLLFQQPGMDDASRAAFLSQFRPDGAGVTVGLAVMGGVFAEGIDLPAERLCGAVIVGVGLPQLCLERNVLRDSYEQTYAQGYRYAYQYPGITKVLQAAGRIIRTPSDRGTLLLIDQRYTQTEYLSLLPAQWSIRRVRNASQLTAGLREFWNEPAEIPDQTE